MSSTSPLPGTTNEGQTLGFHPANWYSIPVEHQQKCNPLVEHQQKCNLRSQQPWLSPPLSLSWKSIFRHVPWHRQESEAWCHTLMKTHWLKTGAWMIRSILIRYLVVHAPNSGILQEEVWNSLASRSCGWHEADRRLGARISAGPNHLYSLMQTSRPPPSIHHPVGPAALSFSSVA
jgi:hypothetical protein